jgi:hypothetical protein
MLAYDPLTKLLGLRDPQEVYTQGDYVKGMMAESLYGAAYGNMGSAFLGNRLSMDQAQSMTDDIYGFMRQRGFQGLELNRIAPMLGESGLLGTSGTFSNVDEALNQFQNKLEGFLDKIATTVRSTSMDIEQATALTISQSMLAGQSGPVAGMDYIESAQTMSNLTGMSVAEADQAMRASMGPWGSTVYDRRNLAMASTFNVGAATTAAEGGGRWQGAWVGADAGQFGLRMANYGNQYWMNNRRNLARLYAAGATPGTDAWNSMVAGEGIPESIASYGDIGDRNARLEAEFYGMQVASENPNMMTAAAMGMMVDQMSDAGVTSREAQLMYMMNKGWSQAEASRFLGTYDQLSTPRGRAEMYFGSQAANLQSDIARTSSALTSTIGAMGSLSMETDPRARQAMSPIVAAAYLNNMNVPSALRGAEMSVFAPGRGGPLDMRGGFESEIYLANDDPSRLDATMTTRAISSVLAREMGVGEVRSFNFLGRDFMVGGAPELANELTLGAISSSDDMMGILGGMRINRSGRDIGVEWAIREEIGRRTGRFAGFISDAEVEREIRRQGGLANVKIDVGGERYAVGELWGGGVEGVSTFIEGNLAVDLFQGALAEGVLNWGEDLYARQQDLGRVMAYRFGGGETDSAVMSMAARGGYLEDVEFGGGYEQFGTMATQMDAMMYLGRVPESSQGYLHDPAHSTGYREFLTKMNSQGYTMRNAVQGLDHRTAEGQMQARNNIANVGFGKAYGQLSQAERNYVEEFLHANDSSGEQGSRNWAGRHDEIASTTTTNLLAAADDMSFGAARSVAVNMERAAEVRGVTVGQIEAYAAYQIALEEGASEEQLNQLRDQIGTAEQMRAAEQAMATFENLEGIGRREALGKAFAARSRVAVMDAATTADLTTEQAEALWREVAGSGSLEGIDADVRSALEGAGYDLSSLESFFSKDGEVPTWALGDQQQNRLTRIPEFQGAMNAVVTPAGGAMPVVLVGGRIGFDQSLFREVYESDNEALQESDKPSE